MKKGKREVSIKEEGRGKDIDKQNSGKGKEKKDEEKIR